MGLKRVIGVFLLVLLLLPLNCGEKDKDKGLQGGDGEAEDTQKVTVEIRVMETESVSPIIESSGIVQARREATITSEISGKILEVQVDIGDKAEEGALLVQIDPEPYRIALDQASATYTNAVVAHDEAKKNAGRSEELWNSKDISEAAYDQARFALQRSEAGIKQAEAALAQARRNLRLTKVVAPFAGVVAQKFVQEGEVLIQGMQVVTLVDMSELEMNVGFSESDIQHVEVGQSVRVIVPALPEQEFQGRVEGVGPKVLSPTMNFPVRVLLTDTSEALKIGMVAKAELSTQKPRPCILLQQDEAIERYNRHYVFLLENETTVKEREIELGQRVGTRVIIEKGLSDGDRVVVVGQRNLKDGDTVRVTMPTNGEQDSGE